MAYTPKIWKNKPNTETPINADNLNHMEQGISDAHVALENKVDKVDGKGLSTNDYTTEEKGKLSELSPEVEDIRIGADGTVYQSAGDSVRNQIGNLNYVSDAVKTPIKLVYIGTMQKAIKCANDATDGTIIDVAYGTNYVTGKIDVKEYETLIITGSFSGSSSRYNIAYYDENDEFISGARFATTTTEKIYNHKETAPVGTSYAYIGYLYNAAQEALNLKLDITKIVYVNQYLPIYVAPNGNDDNSGESADAPKLTVQKCIDAGYKNIFVASGTYQGQTINIDGLHGVKIRCITTNKENNIFESHIRQSHAVFDNSTELTFEQYNSIYRSAYSADIDSTYYKVFVSHELDVIYSAGDYYGRVDTYNAILWEMGNDVSKCKVLVPVLSLSDCENTQGTFYYDGTYVYLNPYDGTIANKSYKTYTDEDKTKTALSITNSVGIFLEGLDFVFRPKNVALINGCEDVEFRRCRFGLTTYQTTFKSTDSNSKLFGCTAYLSGADGFGINGYGKVDLYDCNGIYCNDDGVSHHDSTEGVIDGGKWMHNLKGGVTPSYGSLVTVRNVYASDNNWGLYYVASENDGRITNVPVIVEDSVFINSVYDDIRIRYYDVISHGICYATKDVAHGTLTEYGNTIVS